MMPGCLACGMLLAAISAAAETFVVPAELWDRPRSGRAVLEQPAVRQSVDAYLARAGALLVIRHGRSQESLLAAEELRAWLAALAVEPARISLRNDLTHGMRLRIEVVQNGSHRGDEKR